MGTHAREEDLGFCVLVSLLAQPTMRWPLEDVARLRSLLVPPSAGPYNLSFGPNIGYHASEPSVGQDAWVDHTLKNSTQLFAVESGAYDGETQSNTLWLETQRQWGCLLVEANPYLADAVLRRHRRCHLLRGALSVTGNATFVGFRLAGAVGSLEESQSRRGISWIMAAVRRNKTSPGLGRWGRENSFASGRVVEVPSFPLPMVLHVLGRHTVDYWSLDVEGSEAALLISPKMGSLRLGVMTIEHNNDVGRRVRNVEAARASGLRRVRAGLKDDFFASPSYFEARGWAFPPVQASDTLA